MSGHWRRAHQIPHSLGDGSLYAPIPLLWHCLRLSVAPSAGSTTTTKTIASKHCDSRLGKLLFFISSRSHFRINCQLLLLLHPVGVSLVESTSLTHSSFKSSISFPHWNPFLAGLISPVSSFIYQAVLFVQFASNPLFFCRTLRRLLSCVARYRRPAVSVRFILVVVCYQQYPLVLANRNRTTCLEREGSRAFSLFLRVSANKIVH